MVNISIDGKKFEVPAGQTILTAASENGFRIPSLCHHAKLEPFTSCFVCLVEVKGARGFLPACSAKVADGMEISISGEAVREARRTALELLVSDHFGDCEAPCVATCPSQVPIRDFLALAAAGKPIEAARKIRETLPFPGSLGRVCPRFCEKECRRGRVEQPLSICFMKRFVSDAEIRAGGPFMPEPAASSGKKVAIIGAGPAGLTAAYYLRLKGHAVTIFEKHEQPGGMLKWGIPDYRLPPSVLSKECEAIIALGVEMKYRTEVGRDIPFDQVRRQFDAVFIGVGAQKASDLGVAIDESGGNTSGIISGIDFLERVARGERPALGKRAIIVGGGNTAMDAARSAARLGAKALILYRRTEKEMPADPIEIREARHEGVEFEFLVAPIGIRHDGDRLRITCVRMILGAPDSSGRRRPVPQEGSEFTLTADTCIAAIGQQVDSTLADGTELEITRRGTFVTDPRTLATNLSGVFAGGDCATGADVAVRAIDAGRRAAVAMDQYLLNQPVVGERRRFQSSMGKLNELPDSLFSEFARIEAARMPALPAATRIGTFDEVETGFSDETGAAEAKRCLRCGCVESEDCRLREYCTEYGVEQSHFAGERRGHENDKSHPSVILEGGKCISCGICVRLLEKQGSPRLGFVDRGFSVRVRPAFGQKLGETREADYSEAAAACPTAGLVPKAKYAKRGIEVP